MSSSLDSIPQPCQPLLELPEVSTVQQAQESIQKLQLQTFVETRRLHGEASCIAVIGCMQQVVAHFADV